jgi:hypothetical protein
MATIESAGLAEPPPLAELEGLVDFEELLQATRESGTTTAAVKAASRLRDFMEFLFGMSVFRCKSMII